MRWVISHAARSVGCSFGIRAVVAALLLGAGFVESAFAQVPSSADSVSRHRMREAARVVRAEKARRSVAEQKVEMRLLHAARGARGETEPPVFDSLRRGVQTDSAGRMLVDVRARVSVSLLREVAALGGSVVSAFPQFDSLRVALPAEAVVTLASRSPVRSIRMAQPARVRALDRSEGDVAHRAAAVRARGSLDGNGVAVGVISDGVDSLSLVQSSGDLPFVAVLPGLSGSGDEGTAMLEVVHDLAPGADLLFATGIGGKGAFAANIQALVNSGADVIVDDLFYLDEAAFQDDLLSARVTSVVGSGVVYVSAAGNAGNAVAGTAGVWEGDWLDSGDNQGELQVHSFGGGSTENVIVADSPFSFTLQWSDEWNSSSNDYDLLLFAPDGTLLDMSTSIQSGTQAPFEEIFSGSFDDSGNTLMIVRDEDAQDRYLHLNTHGGELAVATEGQILGHPAAPGAISVSAVDVTLAAAGDGGFDGSESVESFVSDGPRRVFFNSVGSPLTPGDFSSTGGFVRLVPDLTGADCVSTSTPGFSTFCGTSAGAPHVAAIAALLLELDPNADVPTLLRGAAIDLEIPGFDSRSGHGVVDALSAVEALLMPEPSVVVSGLAGGLALLGLARRRRRD